MYNDKANNEPGQKGHERDDRRRKHALDEGLALAASL